jgi:hypothetical protein
VSWEGKVVVREPNGVNREAGGVDGLLFQREVWVCLLSRFGQVGSIGGLWLVKEGGGEGERGTGGCLA